MHMRYSALALLASLVSCAPLAQVSNVAAPRERSENVTVLSKDLFNIDARLIENPVDVAVPGKLVLPPGAGPFPALIVINSSAGTNDEIWDRLLRDLPKHGYAALGLQTFLGRGIIGGVDTRQGAVSFLAAPADALFALRYLRTRPEIDSKRICVIGHSRGGQAAFNFLYFKTYLELVNFSGDPFACNISINTGGHYRPESLQATGRPALVFIGEEDDVWHMDVYRRFVESVRDAGNPVEIYTIKHSFHGLTSVSDFCAFARTAKGCTEQV